jgi:hypothetical protein
VVDLVGLEMGLSVYSGTSRLPLIIPFKVIVLRDTMMYTIGEKPYHLVTR